MKPADKAIKDVLARFGEEWTESTVWRVQGTAVISHKTLERIAQRAGIAFDPPTIIRAERDEAVILVTGHRIDQSSWSIGEACINQNYRVSGKQAAYPWAMAEKRAKDRVILKLIGLHGLLYSEEEADEFRARAAQPQASEDEGEHPSLGYIAEAERRIAAAVDRPTLLTWWNSDDRKQCCRDFELSDDEVRALYGKVKAKADALQARVAA